MRKLPGTTRETRQRNHGSEQHIAQAVSEYEVHATAQQQKTGKTPEGRSATFIVQGLGLFFPLFFFLIFMFWNIFSFVLWFLYIYIYIYCFFFIFLFCFDFFIFSFIFFYLHFFSCFLVFFFCLRFFSSFGSLNSGRSKVTRVTVGRDIHRSCRVCKVNLATLKVATKNMLLGTRVI